MLMYDSRARSSALMGDEYDLTFGFVAAPKDRPNNSESINGGFTA